MCGLYFLHVYNSYSRCFLLVSVLIHVCFFLSAHFVCIAICTSSLRDPVTDFRGMGSLALHSLVYMATHHPRMTRFLVNEQSLREFEYPLCCAVINIVDKLASLLHLKEAFSTPHQHQQKRRPQEEESHKHERIQVSKPQSSPRRPPPPPGRLTTSPSSPAALSSISIQSPSSSSPLSSPPPRTRNAHNKAAPDSALSPSFTASLSSPSAGGRFALSSIFRSMFRSDHKSASPLSSAQTSPTTSPFRLHRPPPPPRQSDGSDSKEHFKQTEKETHRGNRTDLRPASASLSSSSSPSPALSSYALQRQRVETMLSSPLFQLFCRSLREDGEAQKGKKNKGTKIEKTCHHCYSALLADNEAMGVTRDDKVNCTSSSPLPSSSSVLPSACLYTCSVPGVTRSSLSSLPSSAAAGAPKRDLLTASGQDNNEDLSYDIVGAQAVLTASFHPCNGTVENEDNGGNRRAGEPHPPSSPPPPLCYHKAKNDNPLHYCLLEGGLKNIRSKVSLSTSFSSPSYYYFLYDMCQGVDGWEREIGVDPTFQDQNKGEKDDGGTSPPFQPFHELVCALISLLDVLWVRQRASYMQFPMVLRQVEQHLQHQIKAEPLSFETLIYRLSLTAYTLGQEQGQK